MIIFLSSRPDIEETNEVNPANNFIDNLKQYYPQNCQALYISSDPEKHQSTDKYAKLFKECFEKANFLFQDFNILDSRNDEQANEMIDKANFLILAGGHVPTQNHYFQKINLKEKLQNYQGLILGISAGSMNAAEEVYAIPELDGEADDKNYKHFINGLGLVDVNLLPHYQLMKDETVDNKKVIEEIACKDSIGKCFYGLCDGSYLLINQHKKEIYGEAYQIKDGTISKISENNKTITL